MNERSARREDSPHDLVDAHLHLWDPHVLRYDWLSGRLAAPHAAATFAPVTAALRDDGWRSGSVFVQAETVAQDGIAEAAWALSSVNAVAEVVGAVGYAPLLVGDGLDGYLDRLSGDPRVVGVRYILQDRSSEEWVSPRFTAAASRLVQRGLSFDACVRHPQLHDLDRLLGSVPGLRVVLDHLGKPLVGSAADPGVPDAFGWKAAVRRLASHPDLAVKVSGLPAESAGPWTPRQLAPFLDVVLEAFGPHRLLFGSDWPVSGDGSAGDYLRWVRFVHEWAVDRIGTDGAADVMAANARRFYRLSAPSAQPG